MRMRNVLLGALLVLPAFAHADDDRAQNRAPEVARSDQDARHHRDRSKECDERPRPVLLETGLHVDLAYCGAKPNITTTVGTQDPSSDGKFYTTLFANSVTSGREAMMLRTLWGVDDLHVRYTASGSMIRFSYRVVDAAKAKVLNDKKLNPYLIVLKTGSRLQVPEAERVGKLRQTAAPANGREYWMAFTNVGRTLKPGDHVDIVIGTFHAKELVVESAGPPQARNP